MRFLKKLFKPQKDSGSPSEERSKYLPEEETPLDERFTVNFRKNGGKFLYCESMSEVLDNFDNILLENDWYEQEVYCTNSNLIATFNSYNLKFSNNPTSAFFLSNCESLVADGGAILVSSNQLKDKKIQDLPDHFIVFATTSQLVNSIGEGLRKINRQSNRHTRPTNITTINNFTLKQDTHFMTYGSTAKNLYLLLLEDL